MQIFRMTDGAVTRENAGSESQEGRRSTANQSVLFLNALACNLANALFCYTNVTRFLRF